jgi:hypothetical protein
MTKGTQITKKTIKKEDFQKKALLNKLVEVLRKQNTQKKKEYFQNTSSSTNGL